MPHKLSDVIAANRPVFSKLFAFSVFMFAASLGTFFAFRSEALAARFVSAPANYDTVGLIACVLVVNACIAGYVWMAFNEAEEEEGGAAKRD